LLQKFSKHKNNNSNNININKNDIFIKCSFDEKTIEQNKQLLSQYEKSGLIKTGHYFSLDKEDKMISVFDVNLINYLFQPQSLVYLPLSFLTRL